MFNLRFKHNIYLRNSLRGCMTCATKGEGTVGGARFVIRYVAVMPFTCANCNYRISLQL